MPQTASQLNPFMLMLNPEGVLAAIERSEHLSQLNRHLCRPLDRIVPGAEDGADVVASSDRSGREVDAE